MNYIELTNSEGKKISVRFRAFEPKDVIVFAMNTATSITSTKCTTQII